MNGADIAWILISAGLVWLMVPGLALFYGGLSQTKTTVNTLAMVMIAVAVGGVVWFTVGYSLTFSGSGPIIGNLDAAFLHNVSMTKSTRGLSIPDGLFALFQGMFPMITMAIIAGSVVGRMNFKAFILFLLAWMLLVYVPLAHMVWGDGIIASHGALDFAGGDVVHISSGVSGLVLALLIGKRRKVQFLNETNLIATVVGGGLLWFGWFGFNAGSALAANGVAIIAFTNTSIAAAFAMLTWVIMDMVIFKRVRVSGAMSGGVAGLVAITPGAGFVQPAGAMAMGIIVAIGAYFATNVLKNRLGYDDTLDAFGLHGVGGVIGGILTGLFASKSLTGQSVSWQLLGTQLGAMVITILLAGIMTIIIAKLIELVTPLRVDEAIEEKGLDYDLHGEINI
ncbi:ammonium transporter [Weissella sagaensis]|jgi:Amt family ammonium transporter|uniref:ammonium transporter n=1 Tax=Weissella sagaensis TaxID=2559928 RepID=UPI0005A9A967|nr:ammonium transporter [Weissella sagaensis]KAA8432027.1 ammonium transporter [Weissella paramesenteroides]KAA8436790.1 ammonium transporter [Weissella paramesenteroides]QDJ58703.1 ammonium transporter [Weissella hellenica]QEA57651.1 ammonium transporter [Weissella hellenica]